MVYGLEGVAKTYLDDNGEKVMCQKLGGSDVCENMFSDIRFSNQRPTGEQAKKIVAKHSGFCGADGRTFMQAVKSNSNRDDLVDLECLSKNLRHTRKKLETMVGELNKIE